MNTEDPDPLNPPKINLKALCSVISGLETFESEETFWCSPEEALAHIEGGQAELAEIQAFPPVHILNKLDLELENLGQIGPEWRDGTRLQKFQDGAIAGGSLRSMVEKKQLNWIDGISNLQKDFETSFEIGKTSLGPILKRIEACWLHKKSHFFERTVGTILNDEEMKERGVVCLLHRRIGYMSLDAHSGGKGREYDLYQVGRYWVQFYLQMQNVKDKLKLALIECLQTGRVLAVNKKSLGTTLVLPSYWLDNPLKEPKDGKLVFVFSRDFPATWFQSPQTLPSRKSKASRWLVRAEQKLDAKGVRASKKEYENIMMRKFCLTKNAAEDVWKQADRIYKGKSGYISDDIRASKEDLMEIEQDN